MQKSLVSTQLKSMRSPMLNTLASLETFENINPLTNPSVWGPSMWFTLHNGAANYPKQASPIIKKLMRDYILAIPILIPCTTCKEHATQFLEANHDRLYDITVGRDTLFTFFVDFHNYVNRRLGKPTMALSEARKLYFEF